MSNRKIEYELLNIKLNYVLTLFVAVFYLLVKEKKFLVFGVALNDLWATAIFAIALNTFFLKDQIRYSKLLYKKLFGGGL